MKTNSNILILSAGRRVGLVQAFSNEMKRRELTGAIFGADVECELSAACQVADEAFTVPNVQNASYIEEITKLCVQNDIRMVVPTIDTELEKLAFCKEKLEAHGVSVVISSPNLIQDCQDKRRTAGLFNKLGINTPKLYDANSISFPCFKKPVNGSGSVGAGKVESPDQLTDFQLNDQNMIFMELIDEDHQEYTVDMYFNRFGELKCLIPRQRLETRGGETSKGVTKRDHVYDYLMERVAQIKGAIGCLTLQIFATANGKSLLAIEVNPRFGGGFPLSYEAGANFPGWLIDEYIFGKDVAFFDDWTSDLLMLRYDAHILRNSVD